MFSRGDLQPVAELIERMRSERRDRLELQLKLAGGARPVTAFATATALRDEQGIPLGLILFLEASRSSCASSAWKRGAKWRRIAHEIKNPLTPIQLSAQRLRKRYAATLTGDDAVLLDECTRTISAQVEQLKRLVNEFSAFARLPALDVAPHDLRAVVEEALVLFREGHREVAFTFTAPDALPMVDLDPDAIKRAVINLLDNAVHACAGVEGGGASRSDCARPAHGPGPPRGRRQRRGMTPDVQARVFEPYFSTKKDGSGLGLAIVSAIIADHHAYIRVRDNQPRGVRLVIEFPLRQPDRLRAAVGA